MDSNRIVAALVVAGLIANVPAFAQTTPTSPTPAEGEQVQPKFLWGLLLKIAVSGVFEAFDIWAQNKTKVAQQKAGLPATGYQLPPGYPSQAPGYPSQAPGYPSQAPGYPSQALGYPAQVPGYPSQTAGYPPQQAAGYAPAAGGVIMDIAVAYAQYRQQQTGRQPYFDSSQMPPGQTYSPGLPSGYAQPLGYPQPQSGYPQQDTGGTVAGYPQQPSYPTAQPSYPQPGYPQQPSSPQPQPTYPQQPGVYSSPPSGYQQPPGSYPPPSQYPGDPGRPYVVAARSIILVGQQPAEPLKTANNQNNYQMARVSILSADADGKQMTPRSIKDGFHTGERIRLRILSTFDALVVIENISPAGQQKQIYPSEVGKAVLVSAGQEVLLPLDAGQSFQFAEDAGKEQLVITLRDPRAFGPQASSRPVYREDRPEFSTFAQEVAPDVYPVIGQAITLQHVK